MVDPYDKERLSAEQFREFHRYVPIGVIASLVNSLILVFILWGTIAHSTLAIWFGTIVVVSLLRYFFLYRCRRSSPAEAKRWNMMSILGVALSGILWGSAGIFLFPVNSIAHQVFIAFVLGGMVAGAAGMFSTIVKVFLIYSLPALIPMIVRFFIINDQIHLAMGVMGIFFWLMMYSTARRVNFASTAALKLNFSLAKAKDEAEKVNEELKLEVRERKKVEEELQKHQEHLADIVEERTDKLQAANTKLRMEIAERKQAEKALQGSEEKFRSFTENAPDFIVELDQSGTILFTNKTYEGVDRKEVIGSSVYDSLPNDYRSIFKSTLECAIDTRDYQFLEYIAPIPGDESRWHAATMGPIVVDDEVKSVVLIIRDVTERKRAETALLESEEKYRALIENANETVLVAQDGMIKFTNPKATEVIGYSQTELIAKPFVGFIHSDDQEMVTERYLKRLNGEEVPQTYSFRLISKSGDVKWIDISATLIDWEGKPATLNLLTDITERRQAEAALRESQSLLAKAQEIAEVGSWKWINQFDSEEVIWSDQTFRILGFAPNEIQPTYEWLLRVMHPDDVEPVTKGIAESMRTSEPYDMEYRLTRKDKKEIIVHSRGEAVLNEAGEAIGLIGVIHDITDRKQMEEEILKVQKLESIGVLAGGIAHDLNNLLTGVVGNISLARMYKNPAEKDKRLAEAEKASMLIKDLTQQLLTFSKGGAPILQAANIADLLRDSVTFALSGSNIRYDFFIPDDLWAVEIDEGQMNQVINNLVINAKQAMPGGGVIRVRAENTDINEESDLPLEAGSYVRVSVEDEGIGISAEHIHKIFDPFYTTKQEGSGLGLATSYSIVEKHKGHMTVESQIEVGTTFHIYLPAAPVETLIAEETAEKKSIMGEGRVLVMDDKEIVGELATDMLSSLGYSVTTAIGGAEAIETYKEAMDSSNPFDVVILDLTIPGGIGGKETIQRLLKIDPEVKAIVSSGYSNDPVLANFGEYGFKGVITKPYKTRELSTILHRVITE